MFRKRYQKRTRNGVRPDRSEVVVVEVELVIIASQWRQTVTDTVVLLVLVLLRNLVQILQFHLVRSREQTDELAQGKLTLADERALVGRPGVHVVSLEVDWTLLILVVLLLYASLVFLDAFGWSGVGFFNFSQRLVCSSLNGRTVRQGSCCYQILVSDRHIKQGFLVQEVSTPRVHL